MPTLVDYPFSQASPSRDRNDAQDDDDASETMIFDDTGSVLSPNRQERIRAALDESTMLLSPSTAKLDCSSASDSLLAHMNTDSIPLTQPESKMDMEEPSRDMNDDKENDSSFHNTSVQGQKRTEFVREPHHCPNRDSYERTYKDFVHRTISNFDAKHPGRLRDYRQMSTEDKQDARQNVMSLLGRLGITKNLNNEDENQFQRASQSQQEDTIDHDGSTLLGRDDVDQPKFDPDETALTLSPETKSRREVSFHQDVKFANQRHPRNSNGSENVDKSALLLSPQGDGDKSAMLLSPQEDVDKSAMLLSPQDFQCDDLNHQDEESDQSFGAHNDGMDESVQDSVELPRRARASSTENICYDSPEQYRTNPQKRLASSSGKRGADTSRQRLSQESTPPSLSGLNQYSDSDIELSSHVRRLSIASHHGEPKDLFLASQSPIQPKSTYDSDEQSSSSSDASVSRRSHSSRHYAHPGKSDVTVDTINSYPVKSHGGRAMRKAPAGVRLAPGATFHLEKLPVKRTEAMYAKKGIKGRGQGSRVKKRFINFPDPLVRYSKRHRRVLKDIYAWISDSEKDSHGEDSGSPSRCVIFSLTEEKIIDLTLKLLLADALMDDSEREEEGDSQLVGKTIIVVRGKDDLPKWESALREGTGCSVLNHATLPLSERVRSSTAERAAKYDVVLTTYDSLKSPDVTIQVDEMGHAVAKQGAPSGGEWFSSSSRDDAPRICKQLSVLHRLTFDRIIFTDALGRKSFLAKPGTTRAVAFNALRGNSRLVFFTGLEDFGNLPPVMALKKSDRRAVHSVSTLLRLTEEYEDEADLLDECVCDADDMYDG